MGSAEDKIADPMNPSGRVGKLPGVKLKEAPAAMLCVTA